MLGLIAAPAGAAHLVTTRPYRGLALSAAIAVTAMWAGLAPPTRSRPSRPERDHRLRGSGVRGGLLWRWLGPRAYALFGAGTGCRAP